MQSMHACARPALGRRGSQTQVGDERLARPLLPKAVRRGVAWRIDRQDNRGQMIDRFVVGVIGGLLMLAGCSEAGKASTSESSPSSTGGTVMSSGETIVMDTGESAAETSADTTDTATPTTGDVGEPDDDPCRQWDAAACPAECQVVTPHVPGSEPCEPTVADEAICITVGPTYEEGHRTTFYGEIGGKVHFLLAGTPCTYGTELTGPAPYWHECTGTGDEPAECGCLCGANGCPYRHDAELLESCGYTPVCDEPVTEREEMASLVCALQAARHRTPGRVVWRYFYFQNYRAYIEGDVAQWMKRAGTDFCTSVVEDRWSPTQRCQLKPPAYFENCLKTDPGACFMAESWFEGCVEEAASCP